MRGETTGRTFMPEMRGGAARLRINPIFRGSCMRFHDIFGMIAGDAGRPGECVGGPYGARNKQRKHECANSGDGECRTKFPTHGAQL